MDIWTAAAVLSILTRMCYSGDLRCSCVLHVIPTFMLIVWILYTLVEFSLVTCCHWVFRCCDVCCCTRLLLQQWSLSAAVDARNPLEFSPSLAECTAAAVLISENSSDLIVLWLMVLHFIHLIFTLDCGPSHLLVSALTCRFPFLWSLPLCFTFETFRTFVDVWALPHAHGRSHEPFGAWSDFWGLGVHSSQLVLIIRAFNSLW